MKTNRIFYALLGAVLSFSAFSQEWEPQTHVTGYINAVAEWTDVEFVDQKIFGSNGFNKNYAIGLSEVGLLATYKPTENIEFKGTMVYTNYTFHVSQIFVEAYGMYHFNDLLKFGVGRFLTPLSPVNLYFYAPLNPSGAVPMLVSHHFMFPQSISGFQLNGEYDFGSVKAGYAGTLGSYPYINHFESGVLGLQAQEDSHAGLGYYDTEADKINRYFCATGRGYAIINNMLTIGANYFTADAQQVKQIGNSFKYYPSTKYTYGFDVHLDFHPIKVNAEYWGGKQQTTKDGDKELEADGFDPKVINEYKGYYGEIIYNHDVFKPFVRYDYIQDITINGLGFPAEAITVGIAVRPRFETLIKLEYKTTTAVRISDETRTNIHYAIDGDANFNPELPWTSKEYKYNYLQLSFVLSF